MKEKKQNESKFLRKIIDGEEGDLLTIRTPDKGEDAEVGRKNFNDMMLDGYKGLAYDDFKTILHNIQYNNEKGTLQVSVSFARGNDTDSPIPSYNELAAVFFEIPLNIDVVIGIIKDWTNKVNRVRTVLEAIKKE